MLLMAEGIRLGQFEKRKRKVFDEKLARYADGLSSAMGFVDEQLDGLDSRIKVVEEEMVGIKVEMHKSRQLWSH